MLVPWMMNIADANLNLALATNQENGVVFELYFQEDQGDFMKAFLIIGATINSRTEIIAACPSLPADQCTPNHTLMQSKLMWEGSGKPLNILKSLVGGKALYSSSGVSNQTTNALS